jgi:hypothetical protein
VCHASRDTVSCCVSGLHRELLHYRVVARLRVISSVSPKRDCSFDRRCRLNTETRAARRGRAPSSTGRRSRRHRLAHIDKARLDVARGRMTAASYIFPAATRACTIGRPYSVGSISRYIGSRAGAARKQGLVDRIPLQCLTVRDDVWQSRTTKLPQASKNTATATSTFRDCSFDTELRHATGSRHICCHHAFPSMPCRSKIRPIQRRHRH